MQKINLGKEPVSEGLHEVGNPYAAALFDGYCLLTADTLPDAVSDVLKICEAAQKAASRESTAQDTGAKMSE